MDTVRLGVIGIGGMGSGHAKRVLAGQVPRCTLAAVCDINSARFGEFPEIPAVTEPREDAFLWDQGPTRGLGKIQFHDFNEAYSSVDLPNIAIFKEQIELFKEFLFKSASDPEAVKSQKRDIDFLLSMGELLSVTSSTVEPAAIRGELTAIAL